MNDSHYHWLLDIIMNVVPGSGVWRWPIAIAIASGVGLVAALVGDDGWDVLSWVTLSIPVAITALAWRRAIR